jgi:hypothetical protein
MSNGSGTSFQNAYILPNKSGGIIPAPYPSSLGGNTSWYESNQKSPVALIPCLKLTGCKNAPTTGNSLPSNANVNQDNFFTSVFKFFFSK